MNLDKVAAERSKLRISQACKMEVTAPKGESVLLCNGTGFFCLVLLGFVG